MNKSFQMLADAAENPIMVPENTVYVRPVAVADLPDEVQKQAGELTELYAVHDHEGQRLALVSDRKLAFTVARQHEMAPVSVH